MSHFKGAADDIRIWSTARTADQIADNYRLTDLDDAFGLEARYTLDNALNDAVESAPALIDVSGNGHALTAGGPPSDRFAEYVTLNGSPHGVSFSEFNSVVTTGDLTVEMWIRPENLAAGQGNQHLITIGDTAFMLFGGSIGWQIDGAGPTFATSGLTEGEWAHVAFVFDDSAGSVTRYINGNGATPSFGFSGAIADPTELLIGTGAAGANGFFGDIAQVRIYDAVRGSSEILGSLNAGHLDNPPSNLINEYPLDGQLDNTAPQQGSQDLADGTLLSNAAFVDQAPQLLGPNVMSGAASFDGVDDAIAIVHTSELASASWTIEAWTKADAAVLDSATHRILTMESTTASNATWSLLVDANVYQLGVASVDGSFTFLSGPPVVAGLWAHVAGSYDADSGEMQLLVDGTVVDSATLASPPKLGGPEVNIGRFDATNGQYWSGEIADVRIWDHARGEFEIEDGMENFAPTDADGLVANFRLDDGLGGTTAASVIDAVGGLAGTAQGAPGPNFATTASDQFGGSVLAQEDTVLKGVVAAADADGGTLAYAIGVQATNGAVTIDAATGEYEYTPDANFTGLDSFLVSVGDGQGGGVTRTIHIDVQPANDAPEIAAVTTTGDGMVFDGVSDIITVADNPALRLADNFTIEFWFDPKDGIKDQYLMVREAPGGTNNSNSPGVIYGFVDNTIELFQFDGIGDAQPGSQMTVAPDGKLHHVAYTYDGVTLRGYVDGEARISVDNTFSFDTAAGQWIIGAATAPGTQAFDGVMDDVRIYNTAIGGDQVRADMGGFVPADAAAGLQLHYEFESVTGQTVTNLGAAGLAADGALGADALAGADEPTPVGFSGQAMDFLGTSAINVASGNLNTLVNNLTFEAWVNPDIITGTHQIVGHSTNGGGVGLAIQASGLSFTPFGAGPVVTVTAAEITTAGETLSVGQWQHVAATVDSANNVSFYLDGTLIATKAMTAATVNTDTFVIGSQLADATVGSYDGQMFDVRVYDQVRSQTEILADMVTPAASGDIGLVAAWPLNASNASTLTDVTGSNDGVSLALPVFVDTNPFTVAEDSVLQGRIDVSDIDSSAFFYSVVGQGANGTAAIDAAGNWTYAPNADFFGSDTFEIEVFDGEGGTATRSVTVDVKPVNDAPTIAGLAGDALAYAEGSGPQLIDAVALPASVSDVDNADFFGGRLTVSISGGLAATEDQLSLGGAVNLSSTAAGATVSTTASGIVGTLVNAIGPGADLVIDFTTAGKPTLADVDEILRALTYENLDPLSATLGTRTIGVTLDDGAGGTGDVSTVTVDVQNTVNGISVVGAQGVTLTSGVDDVITGSAGDDIITATGLFETGDSIDLLGHVSGDVLNLANGVNTLVINGVETVNMGAGGLTNTLILQSVFPAGTINGTGGLDQLNLGSFANSITMNGIEQVTGGDLNDAINAKSTDIAGGIYNGALGNDTLQFIGGMALSSADLAGVRASGA